MSSDLYKLYAEIKQDIDPRLADFKKLWEKGNDNAVFREMCFCMCTPQNNAKKAWGAVCALEKQNLLFSANAERIARVLLKEGVRFHNNKSKNITYNRETFYPNTKRSLKQIINDNEDIKEARNYLAKTVLGWGMKEASHFLRNIGFGDTICILDRHIMRQLVKYGVLKAVPDTLSKGVYLETETAMLAFARTEKIPADALDMVFWFKETNELFK